MSIIIFDFFNKTNLIPSNNVQFNIGDSVKSIKDKIFISYKTFICPEIMAISRELDGKSFLDDSYITNSNDNKLYFFNILYDLSNIIIPNIYDYNTDDLTYIYSEVINKLYLELSNSYKKLTKSILVLSIKYILYHNIPLLFNSYKHDITIWESDTYNRVVSIKQNIQEQYKNIENVNKILELNKLSDSKDDYYYSIIKIHILYTTNVSMDNLHIIKTIELDDTIQAAYSLIDNIPFIKVYKFIKVDTDTKFFFTSNADHKGLILKILLNKDKQIYGYLILSNSKNVILKLHFDINDNITFNDVNNMLNNIQSVFNKIDKQLTIINKKIIKTNIQFHTNKQISLTKIISSLYKFNNIFTSNSIKDKYIILDYIFNKRKYIRISESKKILNKNYVLNTNLISINGINNEDDLYSIMRSIADLLYYSDTHSAIVLVNNKFIEYKEQNKKHIEYNNVINIQNLRNNIIIDTRQCQKNRQPKVISGKKSSDSNDSIIYYNNMHYKCDDLLYKYPGFTSKNTLCCFKRQQTNKEIYKKNINGYIESNIEDNNYKIIEKNIFIKDIIKTDKILDNYRVGVIPSILQNILNIPNVYRLGLNNLLDILNFTTNSNKTLNDIVDFIIKKPQIFKFLENGTIYKSMSINEYVNLINESSNLDHKFMSDLLSFVFKINIIIVNYNPPSSNIYCKENMYNKFDKYIFILNNNNNYELIFEKGKFVKSNIKKIFVKDDIIVKKILEIYNDSCLIKYIGFKETPISLLNLKKQQDIKIYSQVINDFNNTVFVNTNNGIIPVLPSSPLPDIQIKNPKKLSGDEQYKKTLHLSKSLQYLEPTGQIIDSGKSVGILIKGGLIIPIKHSKIINGLGIVNQQYIKNIDSILYKDINIEDNLQTYISHLKFSNKLYNIFKNILKKMLVHENKVNYTLIKNYVTKSGNIIINGTGGINKCNVDPYCDIDNKQCKLTLTHHILDIFIKKILLELKSNKNALNTKENLILYDNNSFVKRKNEIILYGKIDILKYFNKD